MLTSKVLSNMGRPKFKIGDLVIAYTPHAPAIIIGKIISTTYTLETKTYIYKIDGMEGHFYDRDMKRYEYGE